MEIKKVAGLSEEETAVLVKAGGIVGGVNKAFEDNEIDQLTDDTKKLLVALLEVLNRVVNK